MWLCGYVAPERRGARGPSAEPASQQQRGTVCAVAGRKRRTPKHKIMNCNFFMAKVSLDENEGNAMAVVKPVARIYSFSELPAQI